MMTRAAMQAFRAKYRAGISKMYSGYFHMLSVAIAGLFVICYSLTFVTDVTASQLLVIPATLLFVNFAEYASHRWLGHEKTRVLKLFYQRHTGDHHSFFLDTDMGYESPFDWRVVLFPLYLIFLFTMGIALPGGLVLGWIFNPNVGALFAASTIAGYLLYEVCHFSYHVPPGSRAEAMFQSVPGWWRLRHLHALHHKRERMQEANFNITFPVFDIALGTLYWERPETNGG